MRRSKVSHHIITTLLIGDVVVGLWLLPVN